MKIVWNLLKRDSRLRYLIVGGSSVIVEYGSFWVLITGLNTGAVTGNIISFIAGFLYTFFLHNKWSFSGDHTHSVKRQFMSYGLLAGINVIATTLIISYEVNTLQIEPLIAKLVTMAMVVIWNYLLLSKVIFKANPNNENQ